MRKFLVAWPVVDKAYLLGIFVAVAVFLIATRLDDAPTWVRACLYLVTFLTSGWLRGRLLDESRRRERVGA